MYGLYGFFFKLYGLYGFLSWKYTVFYFHSFQQIFHETFNNKKKSRQNEVSFIFSILNNIRLINVLIDNQNSFISFELCYVHLRICSRSVHLRICLSICLAIWISICISICMSVYLSFYLSVYISYLSLRLSICVYAYLFLCLLICLSICFFCLSVNLFIFSLILTFF